MTALTHERMRTTERWNYHLFTLAMGSKAYKGAAIGLDTATGKVKPAAAGASLLMIGVAAETVDATAADKPVNVSLGVEIEVEWWGTDGTVLATDVGKLAYFLDDQTVTITANGMTAGRVWAVNGSSAAIEKLQAPDVGGGGGAPLTESTEAPEQGGGGGAAPGQQPGAPPGVSQQPGAPPGASPYRKPAKGGE